MPTFQDVAVTVRASIAGPLCEQQRFAISLHQQSGRIAFGAYVGVAAPPDRRECQKAAFGQESIQPSRCFDWLGAPELGSDQRLGTMSVTLAHIDAHGSARHLRHPAINSERLSYPWQKEQRAKWITNLRDGDCRSSFAA